MYRIPDFALTRVGVSVSRHFDIVTNIPLKEKDPGYVVVFKLIKVETQLSCYIHSSYPLSALFVYYVNSTLYC